MSFGFSIFANFENHFFTKSLFDEIVVCQFFNHDLSGLGTGATEKFPCLRKQVGKLSTQSFLTKITSQHLLPNPISAQAASPLDYTRYY